MKFVHLGSMLLVRYSIYFNPLSLSLSLSLSVFSETLSLSLSLSVFSETNYPKRKHHSYLLGHFSLQSLSRLSLSLKSLSLYLSLYQVSLSLSLSLSSLSLSISLSLSQVSLSISLSLLRDPNYLNSITQITHSIMTIS